MPTGHNWLLELHVEVGPVPGGHSVSRACASAPFRVAADHWSADWYPVLTQKGAMTGWSARGAMRLVDGRQVLFPDPESPCPAQLRRGSSKAGEVCCPALKEGHRIRHGFAALGPKQAGNKAEPFRDAVAEHSVLSLRRPKTMPLRCWAPATTCRRLRRTQRWPSSLWR